MNSKSIVIGGLVGLGLWIVLIVMGVIYRIHPDNVIFVIAFFVGLLIGSIIAGVKSIDKVNAWKNGVGTAIFIVIIYLFMLYLKGYRVRYTGWITLIFGFLLIGALIGACGGFVGGKIKEE